MNSSVALIDYGLGNLASVQNALSLCGVEVQMTSDPKLIEEATHLILPGVGSFGDGMEGLREYGLINLLKEQVLKKKKPILGICLGMQLFASRGFEFGEYEGLGFIPGKVIRIDTEKSHLRLPHIGWNNVKVINEKGITKGFEKEPIFYFVHSYRFLPDEESVIAGVADYGEEIVALVEKANIFGTQFHPEKSHIDGIQILKNFLAIPYA